MLGFGICASTILAQTPGTFTATGSLTTPRSRHTATLLPDGRVLIAGGTQQRFPPAQVSVILASAELYDPSTGTFTAAGATTTASGIGTLLGNGKVLITGSTPQLYDPATGKFSPTGPYAGFFPYPETATLLLDGRVLIVGNSDNTSGYLEHDELYDPGTGTFKLTGGPHTYGCGSDIWSSHTATLLPNGKVLFTGGTNEDCGTVNSAVLYDPTTDTFTFTGNMTMPRDSHTATLLADGTVLVAGGQYAGAIASAELYNPDTGTFSPTGSMVTPRLFHTATLLLDGRVLMAGGLPNSTSAGVTSTAELYAPPVLIPAPIPALLSLSGDGKGQGAIQHAGTSRIASADDPAVAGEYLAIYFRGLADGIAIPPGVAVGGRLAEIAFFGSVPGYPGLNVVNIRMPSGVAPGTAVPVRLIYLGRLSNEVTIGVSDAPWQAAITAMKTAAKTDSLNFWQWAWFWQYLPAFSGAPAGFGVVGSISPDVMAQITTAGGGDPLRNISAEQWVAYFRQVVPQ